MGSDTSVFEVLACATPGNCTKWDTFNASRLSAMVNSRDDGSGAFNICRVPSPTDGMQPYPYTPGKLGKLGSSFSCWVPNGGSEYRYDFPQTSFEALYRLI
eukprot:CAMPEP_0181211400 /NCGR_PEP_ID=MMETSP1096-20121128/23763_1 /TAXON_ID=156174 ORGANISM="Chrysochromulina ericina, Strain CCMP281" /NCGR_SAMPLE_ID=MMETSP1096 /ASSEMBLY_ACC=CAM_ASM_000453 /LENGTH=100 /DNA_ID=CAMNT_0023302793 /DNA_START=60 /DNA_END=362 /DNA_ORIENTATION=+